MLVRMMMTQDAAQYATDEMQLNSLDVWRDFHCDDDLDGLAKNLRNPGGTTTNAAGDEVRHPGFSISVMAISNLKVMRLALKHHQHIQRAVAPADITLAWIANWEFLVDFHKEASKKKPKDGDELPKIQMNDWAKTKEKILIHFGEIYGRDGIPLAYLLRDSSDLPEGDDPHDDYDGDHIRELITRAPHTGDAYRADNRTLLRLLKKMCLDTPAYEYISKYRTDGRQAWIALVENYLGRQHVQNQAAIYEAKMQNATYTGESSRFGFDSYVNIHKTSHTRLEALKQHGYAGVDEGTKKRNFLNGMKCPKLATVVEVVRSNEQYETFDEVVRRIKDSVVVMKPTKAPPSSRNINALSVTNQKGEEIFPGVEPDTSMEDKFYPSKEWAKLSAAKKKGVLLKRQKRQGPGKKKDEPKRKIKDSKKDKARDKRISKLERTIGALNIRGSDDEGSDSDGEEPPRKKKKGSGNRGHPALQRRQRTDSE